MGRVCNICRVGAINLRGVHRTKAVGQKQGQGNRFLAHQTALRQLPLGKQIQHRANTRSCAVLDRTDRAPMQRGAVNLLSVMALQQTPTLLATDADKNDHHVLLRRWQGLLQNLPQ